MVHILDKQTNKQNPSKKFFCLFIFSPFFIFLLSPPFAYATGGAFPSTKHGGGTTDGLTPCAGGVNRGLGADYGGDCTTAATTNAYYSGNPEAGTYISGECTHCHEPHSSFGEAEPPPYSSGDSGPDPYLLMKEYGTATNYANLCWYCHENISNINSSGSPLGMGRWSFYQGQSVYTGSSHYISSSFYWPGTTGDPVSIWPRRTRSALPSGNKGSCLNCHTPHGIKAANAANAYDTTSPDGSGGVPATAQTTASNPSVMSNYMIPRQLISWEETLCERCHDLSGPSSKNIQDEINKRLTANQSGHRVDDTTLAGRHTVNENLPITTKHVECYDCHNPHAVKAPTGVLGDGDGGRVKGMKFIDIGGTVRDPATGFRQPYVYEVCLKCHGDSFDCIMTYKAIGASDGTAGCTPLTTKNRGNLSGASYNDQRGASNKRKEFDPNTLNNGAYHPVYQAGRNTSIQLCNQLKTAFNLSCANQATATAELSVLTINCTDCHNNDATGATRGPVTQSNLRAGDKITGYAGASPVGPHGSTNYRILRANYNTEIRTAGSAGYGGKYRAEPVAAMDSNFALCFLCHISTPFKGNTSADTLTNFYAYNTSGDWRYSLHYYHLSMYFSDLIYIKCHECHNNVHSNVEANNTDFSSNDGNTHLINFGPQETAASWAKPTWWYDGTNFRCNLRCHGKTMSSCSYKGRFDSATGSAGGWC